MDQGNLALEGFVVAPSRGWMTPLRAALLMMGAVLGGVALSLILGSSPAHAADGGGSGPDLGPLAPVTSVAATTVSSTVDQAIPVVKHAVLATAEPLVSPVIATVDTELTTIHQLVAPVAAPVVDTVLPVANSVVTLNRASAISASRHWSSGTTTARVGASVPAVQNGAGSGGQTDPILTSSSGAPTAALGVLLALFALVLLVARRRLDDDALPASPTFETDTSPA